MKKEIPNHFILTLREQSEIEQEKKNYENTRSVVVEALKIVQKYRGWVSDDAIEAIAQILNISANDIEGIATFYSSIFRSPVGRHIIRYCDSYVCYMNGYEKIQYLLEKILKIKIGQTTSDKRFTLLPTSCLGYCDKSPALMIDDNMYGPINNYNFILVLLEQYQ
ncbi:MAG: NADH-quinone oxidoreductase subunit NuoE [Candidatus Dasytiphilus stammeri]